MLQFSGSADKLVTTCPHYFLLGCADGRRTGYRWHYHLQYNSVRRHAAFEPSSHATAFSFCAAAHRLRRRQRAYAAPRAAALPLPAYRLLRTYHFHFSRPPVLRTGLPGILVARLLA